MTTDIRNETDFVVAGKALSPDTLDKAKKMGARLICERSFLAMLGVEMPSAEVGAHQLRLL